MRGTTTGLLNLRPRIGAALEARLRLLSPARRQRFALTLATIETWAGAGSLQVLDAGCGDGVFTEALGRRHPAWRVVGIDVSSPALAQARNRVAAGAVPNVDFVASNLTADLGTSLYNVVLAIECLVEIEDDRRALRMLATAVAPEGLLVVHVPALDWRPVLPGSPATWRHEVRHGYDRSELVRMIEETGLTVVQVRGSYRRLVQAAQEIRDRIKTAPTWVRALAFPPMALAVLLEGAGLTWGREQALFAVAVRAPDAAPHRDPADTNPGSLG
jgi:2-polyprenyl-3-methyl-5-hydroxy-6-metoxy-1,4-benzoquinol methylase